ncbi:MAG: right-handed parallel beta-helix repeat-containing protein [Candidatus Eiseniibacteriota bacterium]
MYSDIQTRTIAGSTRTAVAFLTDGVVLRSEAGAAMTSLDMMGQTGFQPEVVVARSLVTDQTIIDGFTITGGPVGASGVNAVSSLKVTVKNCVLLGLIQTGAGGGIHSSGSTSIEVVSSEFVDCTSSAGGGIRQSSALLTVTGCTFSGCSDQAIALIGVGLPAQAIITDCEFIGNSSPANGGGAIGGGGYSGGVTIRGCYFEGNINGSTGGGAVAIAVNGPTVVEDCVFVGNSVTGSNGNGGGLFIDKGVVQRNTFYGNSQIASTGGAAVVFTAGGGQLLNNIIASSTGAAAVRVLSGFTISSGCNLFWQNAQGIGANYAPGSTDMEVDPLLCDPSQKDFTVSQSSPALPANSGSCGQIGALGVGCGAVSVNVESWGKTKSRYR